MPRTPKTSEGRDGIRCPTCGNPYCPVSTTVQREVRWRGKVRVHTRRFRYCHHCQAYFTTVELLEDEDKPGFPEPPEPESPPKENDKNGKGRNPYL